MENRRPQKVDAIVIAALAFGRIIMYSQAFLETLYDGIIPPLLGYKRMQAIIDHDYAKENMYLTEEYNKSGFFLWEREAIMEYLQIGGKCMVLAAGSGREVFALLEMGIITDAWECNERLREYGNICLLVNCFLVKLSQ